MFYSKSESECMFLNYYAFKITYERTSVLAYIKIPEIYINLAEFFQILLKRKNLYNFIYSISFQFVYLHIK